jgi:histidinol-phosphatase (PHP family)
MMFPKCNLHTHTNFCDGKDSPEEVVLQAIALGMHTIGFSGHSHTPGVYEDCCMSEQGTEEYVLEIHRLQNLYRDRIRILCGIERDALSKKLSHTFDYSIGSVHYIEKDGIVFAVDDTVEAVKKGVDECFHGNVYAYLKAYFETLVKFFSETPCDIVGHIDLVEKLNRDECLFSPSDYRYKRALIDAVDELAKKDVIFEINTGAISRGYRTTPYPALDIMRYLAENGGKAVITSDSHSTDGLGCAYELAYDLTKKAGLPLVNRVGKIEF